MKITTFQEKGPRATQEDFLINFDVRGGVVIGVADGHGGDSVSTYCENIASALWDDDRSPQENFSYIFSEIGDYVKSSESGSTLSLVYIANDFSTAVTAFIGDSPIMIMTQDGKYLCSRAHNVKYDHAKSEVSSRKGAVLEMGYMHYRPWWKFWKRYDLGPGLQLSRAFGNKSLNKILSYEPEIAKVSLPQVVLVASDGVESFYPTHDFKRRAESLLTSLRAEGGSAIKNIFHGQSVSLQDNTTVIVGCSEFS